MKNLVLSLAVGSLFLASCVSNPEGEKAKTTDAAEVAQTGGETVAVDKELSKIVWTGHKVSGKHHGEIDIKDGQLQFDKNGQLIGGNFVIDMTSIDVQDLEGEYRDKLTGHLKSDDFFAVESHPEAKFEISSVQKGAAEGTVSISGNLTIRDTTKNITFDADTTASTDDTFIAKADFNIAREDWGVNYPGQADDLISKEINFQVTLEAKK